MPAAVVVSGLAQLGCLFLIWRYLKDRAQWPALGLAAFFLGNVYMAAVFPISLFLVAVLACIGALWSERYLLATVAGAFAATCYPTGVLLGPVVMAWSLWCRRWKGLWVLAGVLLGYGAVLCVMRYQTGRWDAFFRIQEHYGYRLGNLFDPLLAHLKPLVNSRYRDQKGLVTALQSLLATTLMVGCLWRLRRHLASERQSLVLIYSVAFWLAPLALGGALSWYRSEALLLPAVLLVPAFARPFQVVLAVFALLLTVPMGVLFFRSVLV
jgi:hypothetical protein